MSDERDEQTFDRHDDQAGAEREDSESADSLPAKPADDDAALGDTDQHSSSNA